MGEETKAAVCILESLNFLEEEHHREGEIISRTLRLSNVPVHYSNVRTSEELRAFMEEFGKSDYRYLHISCHGSNDGFHVTTEMIPTEEFASILSPHVKDRRIFLSTCLAGNSLFAKAMIPSSRCRSILAPAGTINFDDAAIFWSTFYHLRFKANRAGMKRSEAIETAKQCAKLVEQKFRFYYEKNGKPYQKSVGKGAF